MITTKGNKKTFSNEIIQTDVNMTQCFGTNFNEYILLTVKVLISFE